MPWWAAQAGAAEAKAVKTDGSLSFDAAAAELAAFTRQAVASPAPGAAAAGVIAPGGVVAASPAAARAPAVAAAAQAGVQAAADLQGLGGRLSTGLEAVVRAVREHAALTATGNDVLRQIAANTGRPGAALT